MHNNSPYISLVAGKELIWSSCGKLQNPSQEEFLSTQGIISEQITSPVNKSFFPDF